jgi:hypothetical protein
MYVERGYAGLHGMPCGSEQEFRSFTAQESNEFGAGRDIVMVFGQESENLRNRSSPAPVCDQVIG